MQDTYTKHEVIEILAATISAVEEYALFYDDDKEQDWISYFRDNTKHWLKLDNDIHMGDCIKMPCGCARCAHEENRMDAVKMLLIWDGLKYNRHHGIWV